MNSFTQYRMEKVAQQAEEELIEKLAACQEIFGNDPETIEVLDAALEVVEEEGLAGSAADALEKAASLAIEYIEGMTKEAEVEEAEEETPEYNLTAEESEELGKLAAYAAAEAGVTPEDIDALSAEEAEDFGRALARSVILDMENEG